MRKIFYLLFIIIFGFLSCKHDTKPPTQSNSELVNQSKEKAAEPKTFPSLPTSKSNTPNSEIIDVYPKFSFDFSRSLDLEILIERPIHGEEIELSSKKKKWFALQLTDGYKYDLLEAPVTFTPVFDPVFDSDESQASGIDVKANLGQKPLLIIEAFDGLKSGPVAAHSLVPAVLESGQSFDFMFKGKPYRLVARNTYQLFLEGMVEGSLSKFLLSSTPFFDGGKISIRFAGDLDGDEQLDLILDNSYKYNSETPTLYLSSIAKEGELLGLAGMNKFVGS